MGGADRVSRTCIIIFKVPTDKAALLYYYCAVNSVQITQLYEFVSCSLCLIVIDIITASILITRIRTL